MKKITLLVSLLIVSAAGADTLFARTELKDGQNPSYTLGYCTSEGLEAWAFALPSFPILEVGYTHYFPLSGKTAVLAGGYMSRWCQVDQWYAEPAAIWFAHAGDFKVKSFWGAYVPLNGGALQAYCDPTNLTFQISPSVDLGVAANAWFADGSKPSCGFGPVVNWKVNDLSFSARALAGVNQPNSFRFEVTAPF